MSHFWPFWGCQKCQKTEKITKKTRFFDTSGGAVLRPLFETFNAWFSAICAQKGVILGVPKVPKMAVFWCFWTSKKPSILAKYSLGNRQQDFSVFLTTFFGKSHFFLSFLWPHFCATTYGEILTFWLKNEAQKTPLFWHPLDRSWKSGDLEYTVTHA